MTDLFLTFYQPLLILQGFFIASHMAVAHLLKYFLPGIRQKNDQQAAMSRIVTKKIARQVSHFFKITGNHPSYGPTFIHTPVRADLMVIPFCTQIMPLR